MFSIIMRHTWLLALKRFPTTDEITQLFIFVTSLTVRDEKIVIQQETILLDAPGFIFVDANNFFNPSRQSYLRFVYFLQNSIKNVAYQNFNWSKTNVLNPNGPFLKHIIVFHFIKIFINLKNESIRNQTHIYKITSCFKDYSW